MIEIRNLQKVYKTATHNVVALNEITTSFDSKGLVSIVGVSGCGKTTLLNLIGGLDKDYTGSISFDGEDINKYNSKKTDMYRNEKVGFIFQEYNLINTISVYSNIEIGLSLTKLTKKEKKERIEEISKRLEIYDLLNKKPLELSGGQKQRVAIARAIVKKPRIILADEPTGALDSKTSISIMKILKELSKEYLVLMVSHNMELAKTYSNRILTMLDGKIINDEQITKIPEDIPNFKKSSQKTPVKELFKLSYYNLRSKLVRTLLTILACSIGIVALCLVITVASGMSLYISDVQEQALKTYSITITSTVDNEEPENEEIVFEEYPDDDTIHIVDSDPTYYGHVNTFTNDFMNHIRKMDENLYTGISYTGWVKMRLLTEYNSGYYWTSSYTYLKELNYDYDYINSEYDVLAGKLPENKNELVLVIDKTNGINRNILTNLGIYTNDLSELKFSDIIGKKYKVITNDLYYEKIDNYYVRYNNAGKNTTEIYNKAPLELEIKGIVRQKPNAKTKMYNTCILYSPQLTDYMLEVNNNSQIVKEQKQNPTIDVLTGDPFEIYETSSQIMTVEYQYEYNLREFGANFQVTSMRVYTNKFENFGLIHDYIEEYNNGKAEVSKIKYTDYLKQLTDEFELFMDVLIKVLLIFATISLIVAAIMIVVITYVSVLEQTKQVGILRSLGMGKKHITSLFIFENIIIGFLSGVFGVILGTILIKPVLSIIINIMKDANVTSFNVDSLEMNGFNISSLLLLVIGCVVLTVVSGIIPSILASKKDPVKALNQ